jgi:hypothetical protein
VGNQSIDVDFALRPDVHAPRRDRRNGETKRDPWAVARRVGLAIEQLSADVRGVRDRSTTLALVRALSYCAVVTWAAMHAAGDSNINNAARSAKLIVTVRQRFARLHRAAGPLGKSVNMTSD